MQLTLIATSAFGLEAVVADELRQLGYSDLTIENGKVTFSGDAEAVVRCNLWLRCADRVLIQVGQFETLTFDELFEKTKELPWADFLPRQANFPVEGKSINSRLFSVSDCQAIVKKAIVEKLKQTYPCKWFEESGPRYRIEVALLKDKATLTIDTSGIGLHKRGYRTLSAEAPLKETLAAAIIRLSRWKPDRAFIDPFCGSGTIPIEAAMLGRNMAPGLNRTFAAEKWDFISSALWHKAREEAQDLIDFQQPLGIFGFDIDKSAIQLARYHASQAKLKDSIVWQRQPVDALGSRYSYGYLICNPPYGERLAEKKEVEQLYLKMGHIFKGLDTWSFYILTSHAQFEKWFGRKASKKRKLYNGRIQCNLYQYFGPRPSELRGPFAKDK